MYPLCLPERKDPTPPSLTASSVGLVQQGARLLQNAREAGSIRDSHSQNQGYLFRILPEVSDLFSQSFCKLFAFSIVSKMSSARSCISFKKAKLLTWLSSVAVWNLDELQTQKTNITDEILQESVPLKFEGV